MACQYVKSISARKRRRRDPADLQRNGRGERAAKNTHKNLEPQVKTAFSIVSDRKSGFFFYYFIRVFLFRADGSGSLYLYLKFSEKFLYLLTCRVDEACYHLTAAAALASKRCAYLSAER